MAESVSITPEAPANRGADYAWLKEEGTRLVQQLSGAIWTDYNEHDPGVTTLEQLCYALTELSYRAEFKLADLLTDPRSGRIDTRRQALFVPRRILPSAPVTLDDYRKLIIDRVPGVANVWLMPRPDLSPAMVDGLYDIAIYAPGADPCACDDDSYLLPATICARVRRVYCAWRNLCEDVADIGLLDLLPTVVAGTVVIGDRFSAETILARLLFNLGNFLAPEPRRLPLKALVEAGLGSEAIFEGPLLRYGFIADSELQPKASAIVLRDIIRVMARSPGVMSVRGVSVTMGELTASGADPAPIPIPATGIPYLETKPADGGYPIRLVRNGIEIKPDPARVARELAQLWADQRRTYPLARQYLDYFAVPRGQYRDVETYTSIQNQYPNAYGINSFGLPYDATVIRKAQARQLKGYLLAFEQLLADFFAQLAHLRVLYSTDERVTQTYFYQSLGTSVPDVAKLLKLDYWAGLARIVRNSDPVVARRNRFLDLLLALYAERLDADLMPFLQQGTSAEELLRAKLALLHHLVRATRDRGLGFDYLAIATPHNVAGMELASRIELGMPPFAHRPLADQLEELGLSLVDDDTQASIGSPLAAHGAIIDDSFTPYAAFTDEPRGAGDPESIEQAAAMLRGQRTTLNFLRGFAAGGEIRLGTLPGDDLIAVVSRAPGEPVWRLAGTFAGRARALAATDRLATLAENLTASLRQLTIVEHTLLRFGRRHAEAHGSPPPDAHESFVYSFTVTAILSAGPQGIDPREYRTGVREVIRRNTPAHIVVEYGFLRPRRMARFERLYRSWQQALRRGDPVQIAITSRALTAFLARVAELEAAADSGVIDRDEEQP